jgi:membrane fusion protein (multidrug efflux system)
MSPSSAPWAAVSEAAAPDDHRRLTLAYTETPAAGPSRLSAIRRRALMTVGTVLALGAAGWTAYWLLVGSHYVETDDAYVGADQAQVTPLISGAVKAVLARETQSVHAGDPLVIIDDADARITADQTRGDLEKSRLKVAQYLATRDSLAAQVAARVSDIAHAQAQLDQALSNLERARIDLDRREKIAASGAVSGEELTTARDQFVSAQATAAAARSALSQAKANRDAAVGEKEANDVLIRGTTVETNPEVVSSRAKSDQAQLDLSRTTIRAPIDGVVAKRQVQVGQRVSPGAVLMSIVPVREAYVDANFKEVQLKAVKVGQPVTLTADLYGDKVRYHGRVVGFSGGTGSAFAVIPSQNATGNWIKVVQRVAVRIALEPRELAEHPLWWAYR